MFGWFKRKTKGASAALAEVPAANTSGASATVAGADVRLPPAPSVTEAPAHNPGAAEAAPIARSADAGRLSRGHSKRAAAPQVGMPAMQVLGTRVIPTRIVAVQAQGRRVLVQAADGGLAFAFTRRADRSYRRAGAPDRARELLVIGTTAPPAPPPRK